MIRLNQILFTYHFLIRRLIGNSKSVLDLGCGEGVFMSAVAQNQNWIITGLEKHKPAYETAEKTGIYKYLILGDITNIPKRISKKRYDTVICSQVLEHISKSDGKKSIKQWESLAANRIIITTPNGFIEYEPISKVEKYNPLQKHRSGWNIEEFKKMGYTVRGQGLSRIYGKNGIARRYPRWLKPLMIISYLAAPITYYYPSLSACIIAYKDTYRIQK